MRIQTLCCAAQATLAACDAAFFNCIAVMNQAQARSALGQVVKETAVSEVGDAACYYHVKLGSKSQRDKLEHQLGLTFQFRDPTASVTFTRTLVPVPVMCEAYVQANAHVPVELFSKLLQLYCKGPERLMQVRVPSPPDPERLTVQPA